MLTKSTGATVAGMAPRAPSRAGRNLPAAIGVGVALGALIVGTLVLYKPAFLLVVGSPCLPVLWHNSRLEVVGEANN